MLPIGPLMIEHRLIERVIRLLEKQLVQAENKKCLDSRFLEIAAEFIKYYADRCHHGKEEDILFRELLKKEISKDHRQIMEELVQDHKRGRVVTGELVEAHAQYRKGRQDALSAIVESIKTLVEFYPKHIEKEDKHFFIPVMAYFTKEEMDVMLYEGYLFDSQLIHRVYLDLVAGLENSKDD